MDKFIGRKLRKAREALGLTQASFARAVSLSPEYISVLEAGKRTPSFSTLRRIASYVNRDISYFFYEKPTPPDTFTLLFRAEAVDERSREELQKFRRYCDDYVRLEVFTGRHLELAPLYAPSATPERMADEERRRLGLGDEPIRDIFALVEANGCRILRLPMPDDSKVSGVFVFLEQKGAAFALVNSAQPSGRQAFSVAHEYCHYLKDRNEGPVIDNPEVFVDEIVSLYHPREQFAQTFAARFLMPPSKIQGMIERDFRAQRLTFDQVLYLKRYFGVSTLAMLRTLRNLGYVSRGQFGEYAKLDPGRREKEIFGNVLDMNGKAEGLLERFKKRAVPSDRYRLLQVEASRRVTREKKLPKAIQKTLPTGD